MLPSKRRIRQRKNEEAKRIYRALFENIDSIAESENLENLNNISQLLNDTQVQVIDNKINIDADDGVNEEYMNAKHNLNDFIEMIDVDEIEEELNNDTAFLDIFESDDEIILNENIDEKLVKRLKNIVIEHNVTRQVTEKILGALNEYGCKVPLSKAGLLRTKKKNRRISDCNGGKYLHIGISENLKQKKLGEVLNGEIVIDVGIDGLPLFKSSRTCVWPIIGNIINSKQRKNPFLIGCYVGKCHPKTDLFLKQLCDELDHLKEGIEINGIHYAFRVRCFVADAPARAMLTCTKGHCARNGCSKCDQIGRRISNKMIFSNVEGNRRTDENFQNRTDPAHHQFEYLNKKNVLEEIGIGMVSQFVLDPMHLCDLGVMKKILTLFIKEKSITEIQLLTDLYIAYKQYIPKDFSRKPREFAELPRFKATEFRLMLNYLGIVFFKDYFSERKYHHFLKLCCGLRLLQNENSLLYDIADKLLKSFVEDFETYYGNNLTYNVHGLLHIASCAIEYGPIYNFSAYSNENFLRLLKSKIKKPSLILEQIFNKVQELLMLENDDDTIDTNEISINPNSLADSFCLTNDGVIIKIIDINEECMNVVPYQTISYFNKIELNFGFGINNDVFDIFYGEEMQPQFLSIESIKLKVMALPFDNGYVFIPILHY